MIRRLATLLGGSFAFWVLLAIPGSYVWGESALVCSALAAALCLVPTALTLAWASWASNQSPDQQLVMILGGTGVRMFLVLGSALALYYTVPYLSDRLGFWVWVLVFYLFTLALEMALVLSGRAATGG